jgi:hypothetical protein
MLPQLPGSLFLAFLFIWIPVEVLIIPGTGVGGTVSSVLLKEMLSAFTLLFIPPDRIKRKRKNVIVNKFFICLIIKVSFPLLARVSEAV